MAAAAPLAGDAALAWRVLPRVLRSPRAQSPPVRLAHNHGAGLRRAGTRRVAGALESVPTSQLISLAAPLSLLRAIALLSMPLSSLSLGQTAQLKPATAARFLTKL